KLDGFVHRVDFIDQHERCEMLVAPDRVIVRGAADGRRNEPASLQSAFGQYATAGEDAARLVDGVDGATEAFTCRAVDQRTHPVLAECRVADLDRLGEGDQSVAKLT